MIDKRISLEEAVKLINNNCTLALGGMTLYRRPVSFVKSLIKHHMQNDEPENLNLLTFTAGIESDLLVGAGLVSRIRTCYFGLEIFGLAPMFTYYANRGEIEIIEETEASLAFGLRAQMSGVGFMPARGWLGTDLPKLRPDVKTVSDPYTGEELIAFPAIKPDVAVIHALQVDFDGNADIGKNKGIDEELSIIADTVIITAEEIVPDLSTANILGPFVDAIVLTPDGAKPTSCYPRYPMDGASILSYSERVNDPESYKTFIQEQLA